MQNQSSMDQWVNGNLQVVGNIEVRGLNGVSKDIKKRGLFFHLSRLLLIRDIAATL